MNIRGCIHRILLIYPLYICFVIFDSRWQHCITTVLAFMFIPAFIFLFAFSFLHFFSVLIFIHVYVKLLILFILQDIFYSFQMGHIFVSSLFLIFFFSNSIILHFSINLKNIWSWHHISFRCQMAVTFETDVNGLMVYGCFTNCVWSIKLSKDQTPSSSNHGQLILA